MPPYLAGGAASYSSWVDRYMHMHMRMCMHNMLCMCTCMCMCMCMCTCMCMCSMHAVRQPCRLQYRAPAYRTHLMRRGAACLGVAPASGVTLGTMAPQVAEGQFVVERISLIGCLVAFLAAHAAHISHTLDRLPEHTGTAAPPPQAVAIGVGRILIGGAPPSVTRAAPVHAPQVRIAPRRDQLGPGCHAHGIYIYIRMALAAMRLALRSTRAAPPLCTWQCHSSSLVAPS